MGGGIYIARGMTLALGDLSVSLSSEKLDQQKPVNVKVGFDACVPWLEIALEHLATARDLAANSHAIWAGDDQKAKGELLAAEFRASMQAIVAAAIAIDAFYSNVRRGVHIDKETTKSWHESRASRPARVAETLRTAFTMRQESFENLRNYLHQIYRFRDKAVHPSGELTEPVLHPGMKVGVEWRFVTFRYENALPIVQVILEIVSQLATKGHPTNKKLQSYCGYIKTLVDPLRSRFPMTPPPDAPV